MSNEALSAILKSEEKAKFIIENAQAAAKQASQKAIEAAREKLQAQENERRNAMQNNIARLYSEWEAKMNITRSNAATEQDTVRHTLQKHKAAMTGLVVDYISEKGGK